MEKSSGVLSIVVKIIGGLSTLSLIMTIFGQFEYELILLESQMFFVGLLFGGIVLGALAFSMWRAKANGAYADMNPKSQNLLKCARWMLSTVVVYLMASIFVFIFRNSLFRSKNDLAPNLFVILFLLTLGILAVVWYWKIIKDKKSTLMPNDNSFDVVANDKKFLAEIKASISLVGVANILLIIALAGMFLTDQSRTNTVSDTIASLSMAGIAVIAFLIFIIPSGVFWMVKNEKIKACLVNEPIWQKQFVAYYLLFWAVVLELAFLLIFRLVISSGETLDLGMTIMYISLGAVFVLMCCAAFLSLASVFSVFGNNSKDDDGDAYTNGDQGDNPEDGDYDAGQGGNNEEGDDGQEH